jgi:hypothetical protein
VIADQDAGGERNGKRPFERRHRLRYDANEELIGSKLEKPDSPEYKQKLARAISYWKAVCCVIPDWEKVKNGGVKAPALRQEKINTHGVVLRALGGLGKALMEAYPDAWEAKLEALREIDWRKSVGNKVKGKLTGLTHVGELLPGLAGFDQLNATKPSAGPKALTVQGKHHFTRIKQIDALAGIGDDPNADMALWPAC